MVLLKSAHAACAFNEYSSKLYRDMAIVETHRQTSGPKCKHLCQEDIRCIAANLLLVRGQGFLCEILYKSYSGLAKIVPMDDAMLFVKIGN